MGIHLADYTSLHSCTAYSGEVFVQTLFTRGQYNHLPETFFTVWTNVFERGRLTAGESLLVHGGTSGIGTTAIQLGRVFGATVYATAGSDEKCAACGALGASMAITYGRRTGWSPCRPPPPAVAST